MNSPYPQLFTSIRLGARSARNRLMRTGTTCQLGERGRVSARQIAYYRALARGGVGSIVSEVLRVDPDEAAPPALVAACERDALPGLRALAEAVRAEGALLIGQLNHAGRQHLARRVPPRLVAPSAIACPRSGGVPHPLDGDELRALVGHFATAAAHCAEAGFDGVEIHGAQGYLIQQFLSPFSNRRRDAYGGSLENRLRFALEILAAARQRIGPGVILGFRLGVEEFTPGGLGAEDALAAARALAASGLLDYVSLSQGNFNRLDAHLPDRYAPPTTYRALHARFKAALPGLPTVSAGRIDTAAQAEAIVAAGDADVAGMCRALLADPELPRKAAAGRAAETRRCIGCNQCWGWLSEGGVLACAINPVLGREQRFGELATSAAPRRVLVVGGGPAGLEAARVAALRGHAVTLLERRAQAGGAMRAVQDLPGFEQTRWLAEDLEAAARRAGADIRTGVEASAATIAAGRPDVVVLATGATARAPALAGDGSVPLAAAAGPAQPETLHDGAVVVVDEDGYYWGAAVATDAARRGRSVTLVTRVFEPFREIPVVSRITTLRALDRLGVRYRPNMEVARVERGGVVLRHFLSEREERIQDVAAVLWVGAQGPNDALRAELRALGIERVHVIGDAFAPRRIADAMLEAHDLGRAL